MYSRVYFVPLSKPVRGVHHGKVWANAKTQHNYQESPTHAAGGCFTYSVAWALPENTLLCR